MSDNKRTFHYADERPDGTRLPMNQKQKWAIFIVLLVLVIAIVAVVTVLRKNSGTDDAGKTTLSEGDSVSEPAQTEETPDESTRPGVPVTDEDGQLVTDENGVTVTEPFPTEQITASDSETPSEIGNADPTESTAPRETSAEGRYIVEITDDNWQLVVVNHTREFPESYQPQLSYILTSVYGYTYQLDSRVAPHYEEMYNAAKQDGITLAPCSAYRSYERQKNNFQSRISRNKANGMSDEDAYAEAASVILPPGTSEHNLGLCMDVCNVYDSFVNQPEYAWLQEHAHEYGFILRYPQGKEDITNIVFEPWHWRYVGVEYAKQIKDSGLCLEEWLEQQGIAY